MKPTPAAKLIQQTSATKPIGKWLDESSDCKRWVYALLVAADKPRRINPHKNLETARVPLAFVFSQVAFTQANRFWGKLDQFVICNEFDSGFQGQLNRWRQTHGFVRS